MSGDLAAPCGSVVASAPPRSAPRGRSAGAAPVGPAAGTSAQLIDRDGASVRLPARRGAPVALRRQRRARFVRELQVLRQRHRSAGPAGLAHDHPRRGLDEVGRPFRSATPDPNAGCGGSTPHGALWPLSASVVPVGASDRAVVYLASMCLGPETFRTAASPWGSTGTRRVWTSPECPSPSTSSPTRLPLPHQFGEAATFDVGRANIITYACDEPANPLLGDAFGPCYVALCARPTDVASPWRLPLLERRRLGRRHNVRGAARPPRRATAGDTGIRRRPSP